MAKTAVNGRHGWLPGMAMALGIVIPQAAAEPPVRPGIEASPITLPTDPFTRAKLGHLKFRGAIELKAIGTHGDQTQEFWGYSGLWVSPDGHTVAGVNSGQWMTGTLTYDAEGKLAGLADVQTGDLLDEAGHPFTAEDDRDAEALDFDGRRFLVGFEKHDRILAYASFTGPAQKIDLPPAALANIPYNMGFSSLAALPGGGLIALPEGTNDPGQPGTRAWLIQGGQQGAAWLRPSNGLPVSLAAFPNGDLLVLELVAAGGAMATRLSRIAASDVQIGKIMWASEIALLAPPVIGARIEGASIRKTANGRTMIYLMASDKRSPLSMFELDE